MDSDTPQATPPATEPSEMETLRPLLSAFERSAFSSLELETATLQVKLRQRRQPPSARPAAVPASIAAATTAPAAPAPPGPHEPPPVPRSPPPPDEGPVITSSRVGIFNALRDRQGTLAFRPGELIEEGQVLGLVQSMNLKYELKANRSGVIDRYLVDDGDAVEYGEPLVALR